MTVRVHHTDWLDGVTTRAEEFGLRADDAPAVDLLYADPPFNTGKKQTAGAGDFADTWPTTDAYIAWLRERLEPTLDLIKSTGSVLLHVDWRTSHRVRVLLDELLGEDCFVNHLVWSYGLGGSSPRRFARKHDDILFYSRTPDGHWFDPPMVPATSRRMAGRMKKATDVLDIPAINNMATERVGWPTQKPLALLEMLIGACCPPEGLVLDPCCGSGTTLAAAQKLGRRAVGIDRDERAVEVAMKRSRVIRKDVLQRQQRGKRIFSEWKALLEDALSRSVSAECFLGIEETEQLRAEYFEVFEQHNQNDRRFAAKDALGRLLDEIERSLARDGERPVVLFHSQDKYIGAVRLDAEAISRALEAIWRLTEEDLCVATPDLNSGFCLEMNYYDGSDTYVPDGVFELTAWGDFVTA